ncbi:transposase-like protein [Streptosporangium album]|uniref:Mutator family transposase n=1 Tax=Streptosporangium album TaxID=47479 RepID=A0A7W7S0U1_9ACTN|nr:transposase-like protein [Streptosporangium album]
MAVTNSVDPASWLAEQIQHGDPDLLRSMVKTMAETLMSAEADGLCGADYGTRTEERTNRRNGYRIRDWDTHDGTAELAIPKLRGRRRCGPRVPPASPSQASGNTPS